MSDMPEGPQFTHDCESCIFLGRYVDTYSSVRKDFDLYVCPGEPTVVARYSSEGPDYNSGVEFADRNLAIREAARRAFKLATNAN